MARIKSTDVHRIKKSFILNRCLYSQEIFPRFISVSISSHWNQNKWYATAFLVSLYVLNQFLGSLFISVKRNVRGGSMEGIFKMWIPSILVYFCCRFKLIAFSVVYLPRWKWFCRRFVLKILVLHKALLTPP